MSNPFRLGFLTHFEGEGDARRIYEETLQLFVAADELGFDRPGSRSTISKIE